MIKNIFSGEKSLSYISPMHIDAPGEICVMIRNNFLRDILEAEAL